MVMFSLTEKGEMGQVAPIIRVLTNKRGIETDKRSIKTTIHKKAVGDSGGVLLDFRDPAFLPN